VSRRVTGDPIVVITERKLRVRPAEEMHIYMLGSSVRDGWDAHTRAAGGVAPRKRIVFGRYYSTETIPIKASDSDSI
jgi:hypothetical protein